MSKVKCIIASNKYDPVASACGARFRIESRLSGNREVAIIKDQLTEMRLNNWDRITCVYGSAVVYLIFNDQHNGIQLNMSLAPSQGERKEITISEYLLSELLRESLSNSPKAPKVDYSGVDLSQFAGDFGR